MKCLRKNKNCRAILCLKDGSHYICSGINSKPTKFEKDIITLCLRGEYVKAHKIEMTPSEALLIISVLSLATSEEVSEWETF